MTPAATSRTQIKGIAKISSRILIQIYQSLVGSILSYASSIWQIGNDSQLKKLDAGSFLLKDVDVRRKCQFLI
jgi:hypothetical protein